jgi:hypothetical protein
MELLSSTSFLLSFPTRSNRVWSFASLHKCYPSMVQWWVSFKQCATLTDSPSIVFCHFLILYTINYPSRNGGQSAKNLCTMLGVAIGEYIARYQRNPPSQAEKQLGLMMLDQLMEVTAGLRRQLAELLTTSVALAADTASLSVGGHCGKPNSSTHQRCCLLAWFSSHLPGSKRNSSATQCTTPARFCSVG